MVKCSACEEIILELTAKLGRLQAAGDAIASDLKSRDFFPALVDLWEKAKCS